VSTDGLRNDFTKGNTYQAIQHSRLLVTFGGGGQRIEIRQIEPT
jgi:hypothetical protein